MNKTFIDVINTLLRGIKSDTPIDPIEAAERFSEMVSRLDCEFHHIQGSGYVYHDQNLEIIVLWRDDGVYFKDHQLNIRTLPIIQMALTIISDLDNENLNYEESEEESSSDTEDIWL
jgi:hypothetical protein